MTDIEKAIAKARELEAKATPGDWKNFDTHAVVTCGDTLVATLHSSSGRVYRVADASLIAFDRNTHKLVWDVVEAGRDWRSVAGKYMGEGHEIVTPLEYEKRKVFGKALDALARAVNGGE